MNILRYFDTKEKVCKTFTYGGCGGNGNNYESQRECEIQCSLPEDPVCGKDSEPFVDVNGSRFNCLNKTCPTGYKCTFAGATAVCCQSDEGIQYTVDASVHLNLLILFN